MRSGKYRHYVAFQSRSTAQDAAGQQSQTWTTFAYRQASIEAVTGREFFLQSGERSEIDVKIMLRYDAEIAALRPFDRVAHGNNTYDIEAVLPPMKRGGDLELRCVRKG